LKKLKLLFVFLVVSSLAFAQGVTSQSKIKLTDGSELHVLIIENIPGKYIKVKIPGNEKATIDYKNIVSIKHKSFMYHQKFKLPKGFYMAGTISLLFGRSAEFSAPRVGIGLGATGNYRFNSFISLGLGAEVNALFIDEGAFMLPLYARLSGNFVERRVAPIYMLDAGWTFVANDKLSNSSVIGGWFARPAIGLQINKFTVSVGYQLQNTTTTTVNSWWWGGGDQEVVEERLMKNIIFGASLNF
jgi:hypothetical protein